MHTTLLPKTNLRLLAVWLAISLCVGVIANPIPWLLFAIGGVLGAVAGLLQLRALRQSHRQLVVASTALEVRRAMAATQAGRAYLICFWFQAVVVTIASILLYRAQFMLAWAAGYSAFAAVREALTIRGTIELNAAELNS